MHCPLLHADDIFRVVAQNTVCAAFNLHALAAAGGDAHSSERLRAQIHDWIAAYVVSHLPCIN